ncbi:hypothetical protein F2X82_03760 [Staphylococcus aureus]|nr:hypothetical protein C7Q81_13015 [Staphylococcus aureus]QER07584.1 hypothetical protein F2X82_03760 [Staphylococcus aureus]
MRNYRDISYILNERGFNVHHLTPSKLLSPHTEFFSFTYDTPPLINDITKVTNRYNGLILYLLYNRL